MFGNFNLNAGLSQLQDLGGRFQKIKEDLEQNIESSLRTNIAPATDGNDAGAASTPSDRSVGFTEWEGYSMPASTSAKPTKLPAVKQPAEDIQTSGTSSDSAVAAQPETEHQDLLQPPEVPETKQIESNAAAEPLSKQQQQHSHNPAASAEVAQIPDSAVQDEQQPAADTQTAGDSAEPQQEDVLQNAEEAKHAVDPNGKFEDSADIAAAREDSNGTAEANAAASALQQHAIPFTSSSLQQEVPAAAQTHMGADHSLEDGKQATQAHHNAELDQQHQEPSGRLYASSQLDHASQQSLPDSVQSSSQDQQHSALANGAAADQAQHAADAQHTNGIAHEDEQAEAEQVAVLRSGPQQKHESDIPDPVAQSELEGLGREALSVMVHQLQAGLQAREKQLERQGEQLANMHEVQQQLQARNEELVTKAAKVSEEDMAAMQAECERRLGAAERKVYALAKERDALRRGSDKLSSAHDLLKEKDSIIAQVMEEGERLSIKQSNMEGTIKKLRAQLKELEVSHTQAAAKLVTEEGKAEAAAEARQKAEAAVAAATQQHKADAEQQKQQFAQQLKEAHKSQAAAEERAAVSAKEGLGHKLREAESSAQALAETVEELRLTLDRQRASAELREEGLQREVRGLEQRCQAAEARHQDLAANIPEATRPLLRQLEAMQATATANAQAWAATEASLTARQNEFESAAAAAGEREKRAWEKLQAANTRMAATAAALETLKAELAEANAEVEKAQQAQRAATVRCNTAEEQASQARQAELTAQQRQMQLEHNLREQLAQEQAQSLEASSAAEERIQALQQRLAAHQQATTSEQGGAGEPPAVAAQGYRWQLVRSSDKATSQQLPASSTSAQDITALTDRGSDGSLEVAPSLHSRPHLGTAGEVERLRSTLRQKEDQVASLQSQLTNLEATRDSLAEEVIAAAGNEEAALTARAEAASAQEGHQQAQQQLLACTEMLGEKEERLEELRADLQDVKQLYKDQIEFMVEQLAHLAQQDQLKQQPSV